jgi:small subunit ribosomal protein S11
MKDKDTQLKKTKKRRTIQEAYAYVSATFNNTIITITDRLGNTLSWSSAGKLGFKGSRKSTPFAGRAAAEDAIEKALQFGIKLITVFVDGPGPGRESAIRALGTSYTLSALIDRTRVPHNGCRPQKERRV